MGYSIESALVERREDERYFTKDWYLSGPKDLGSGYSSIKDYMSSVGGIFVAIWCID